MHILTGKQFGFVVLFLMTGFNAEFSLFYFINYFALLKHKYISALQNDLLFNCITSVFLWRSASLDGHHILYVLYDATNVTS